MWWSTTVSTPLLRAFRIRYTVFEVSQIETRTLAEQIAERVRDDILSGRLEAGQRLSQEGLAEQYSVSRVPVRDALRQLQAEGLIEGGRTATVAELSVHDLEELYDMRIALEPVLSRLATPRMRPEDVEEMGRQLALMEASSEPSPTWFSAHAAFHRALNDRAARPRMAALVTRLRDQTERYLRVYQLIAGRTSELGREHDLIHEAVLDGDAERVGSIVAEHLELVRDRVLDHLGGVPERA
jgi:DNA-binding GntR family transcriptional regulator